MPRRRRRTTTALVAVAAGIVVGLSAIVLCLDPLARCWTRVALSRMKGLSATFSDARFSLLELRYELEGLQLTEQREDAKPPSSFSAESIGVHFSGRDLLHAHLVGWIQIRRANAIVAATSWSTSGRFPSQADPLLAQLPRMRIVRLDLLDGEVTVLDVNHQPRTELRLRDLRLSIENVGTRPALEEKRPTLFSASASVGRGGGFRLMMTADLSAERLTFVGNARLRSLDLALLRGLFVFPDLPLPSGQFDLEVAFTCDRGRSRGGIKSFLRNVDRDSVDRDLGRRLRAGLDGHALRVAAEKLPGRRAEAQILSFRADLSRPDLRLSPTVLLLLRSAVIEGLAQGLSPGSPTVRRGRPFSEARRAPKQE